MKKSTLSSITGLVAGIIVGMSAQFEAHSQLTVQRPCNVIGTGSNAWSYLVVEGESYASSQDGDDTTGFGMVYNDAALADAYGYSLLPTNSNASMQAALGTVGTGFSRFSDKVTYQMVFSTPGDYYLYMHFTMFENSANGGNNTYLNEDSFFLPPDFNKILNSTGNRQAPPGLMMVVMWTDVAARQVTCISWITMGTEAGAIIPPTRTTLKVTFIGTRFLQVSS